MEREIKVSQQHIWVGAEGRHVYLGLTTFIQAEVGTIISMELPDVGDMIEEGEVFAELESTATVHELVSPVTGKVLAVNAELEERPSIINEDPYDAGWLVEVRLKDESELDGLMGMDEYYHFVSKDSP